MNDDRVSKSDACPKCGENRLDLLVWIGDDSATVKCETCGHTYEPFRDPPADRNRVIAQAHGYTVADDFGGWRLYRDGKCCGLPEFPTEAAAWAKAAELIRAEN